MQNGIWMDKQATKGLLLQQIHTKDRVRKYDCFTNRYSFDSTLSICMTESPLPIDTTNSYIPAIII